MPSSTIVKEMGLKWNGCEGMWFDKNGTLIAYDPSVQEAGPRALLIRKDAFLRYLSSRNYDIQWIIIGGKQILQGMRSDREWLGQLQVSGMVHIANDNLVSHLNCIFKEPRAKGKSKGVSAQ